MRIAMITGDDLSAFRGGTIHMMEQAENLVRRGHQVVIYAQARGPYPQPTPVDIRYLPAWGHGLLRLLTYNVALLLALTWLALRRWPDLFHTRQMGYSATPLLVAGLFRLPHVLEVNGVLRDELAHQAPSPLRLAVIDLCARLNLGRSDLFTTTTTEYLQRLQHVYGVDARRWRQMPCGVNPDLFHPGDQQSAREELGLPADCFALLHVGSLYDWRGIDRLLQALAHVAPRLPAWELWLVGDGVEACRLRRLHVELGLDGHVRFVGQVAYGVVPRWLVAADVGIVLYKPTRPVPGDPMKIYEYMAAGLPVLAGDHPHYGGIVAAAAAGVVVDDTEVPSLSGAILDLAGDAPGRRRMGAHGVEVARRRYSWARRAEQLEAILIEALEARRR